MCGETVREHRPQGWHPCADEPAETTGDDMHTEQEILRQTAGMVATALGDGWRVETAEDWTWQTCIKGPDDARLFLGSPHGVPKDRVDVSYGLSHLADNLYEQMGGYRDLKNTHITVKRERGPEVIAKEIRRRLLPDLEEDARRVREVIEKDRAALAARRELAAKLTGEPVSTEEYRNGRKNDVTNVRVGGGFDDWYGDAQLRWAGDGVSELKLRSLTVEQALAVLAALTT